MKSNIKNISTTQSRSSYNEVANRIASKYPDYSVIVDGGSYRCYEVKYEVDHNEKTIKLDYYLPLYTDFHKCNDWVLSEIAKGNTSGCAGLGIMRPILYLMGCTKGFGKDLNGCFDGVKMGSKRRC